jgi:hypothetical protein
MYRYTAGVTMPMTMGLPTSSYPSLAPRMQSPTLMMPLQQQQGRMSPTMDSYAGEWPSPQPRMWHRHTQTRRLHPKPPPCFSRVPVTLLFSSLTGAGSSIMQMADGSLVQVTQLTLPTNSYGAVAAPQMAPPAPALYGRSVTPSMFPPSFDVAYNVGDMQPQAPQMQQQAYRPPSTSAVPAATAPLVAAREPEEEDGPLPVDTRPAVAALLRQLTKQQQQQQQHRVAPRGRKGDRVVPKRAASSKEPRRSRSAAKRTPSTSAKRRSSRDAGRAGMSTAAKKLLKARLMDRDFETVSGVTDDRTAVEWGSDSGHSDDYDIGL